MSTSAGSAPDVRALFGRQGFRRLFAVRIAGQFGDGVLQAALASYVFFSPERQPSAAAVAATFAVLLLPYSLVGPFAGVLLDRWRRRQVLLVANLLRAALALAVTWQVMDGRVGAPFFATVLVLMSVTRFVLAGLSAAIPRVVPRGELVLANAIAPTAGAITVIAGVGAGYIAQRHLFAGLTDAAEAAVVATAAIIYILAGSAALRFRRGDLGPGTIVKARLIRAAGEVAVGMVDGARHVAARPPVRAAMAVLAATRFFYGLALLCAILLSRNYLNDPRDVDAGLDTLALLLGLSGAGFLLAAVLTPWAARRVRKEVWASILPCAAAVVLVTAGTSFTLPALAVVAFALGVATQGVKIVTDTVAHENIDDDHRGRVFSFYDVAFNASFVAAAALGAAALPPDGRSTAGLLVIAAGFAVTGVLYYAATSRSREHTIGGLTRTASVHDREHVGEDQDHHSKGKADT